MNKSLRISLSMAQGGARRRDDHGNAGGTPRRPGPQLVGRAALEHFFYSAAQPSGWRNVHARLRASRRGLCPRDALDRPLEILLGATYIAQGGFERVVPMNGNFRLLQRLLQQIERVLELNELTGVTPEVVVAARESLVIGAN